MRKPDSNLQQLARIIRKLESLDKVDLQYLHGRIGALLKAQDAPEQPSLL